MRPPQLLLTLLLCLPLAPASAAVLKGLVRDGETHRPLPAANLSLGDTGTGTFADARGAFLIHQPGAIRDTLLVTHVGFAPRRVAIEVAAQDTLSLDLRLQPRTLELANVIVTASRRAESEVRVAQAVVVAGEEEIAARAGGSTADALREVPGVLVQKTTAGHGAPIIRGLIGKNVLLLYNGVRLNKPTFRPGGNQYMNTIDAESLRRVEVVRGPGSVLYGSDAIGGVVNMITMPPRFTTTGRQLAPQARLRFTSADQGLSLHAGLRAAGTQLATQLGLTLRRVDDLKPGGDLAKQVPTGYREWGIHSVSAYRPRPGHLLRMDLFALRQDDVPRFDQYESGRYQDYRYKPQERFLGMAQYSLRNGSPWMTSLEANLSWQWEHEGRWLQRSGSELLQRDDDRLHTGGCWVQGASALGNGHWLRWGAEYYGDLIQSSRRERVDAVEISVRPAFPDGSRSDALGIFLSDDIEIGRKLSLSLGLRRSWISLRAPLEAPYGRYSDRFDPWTGSFSLAHHPLANTTLFASVARGFRAPNFNDTVVLKTTSSGVDAPSPGLEPETSTNYELGLKWEAGNRELEAFVYRTEMRDLIVERPGSYLGLPFWDTDGDGIWDEHELPIEVKQNADRARIQGAEVQGWWQPLDEWRLRGNATYTHGQNLSDEVPMRRIPPLMGLAGLMWQRDERRVELFLRAAGEQIRLSPGDIDDPRIAEGGTRAWSDWNLRARDRWGRVAVSLAFTNLFDEGYREHGSGVANPGRGVVMMVSVGK